ncbi:hypothetical protein E2562_039422 [Oryza meyeriana var. granulata]|uniref:Berberine/berberine-like domain-containing protein n=1 Tax=Oryza meyeriana var. granulata TaxID=110450 RepID=A0A6G1CWY7_9ORYZ|nr:hypothetical protein E2562_039422 [Oryza meyeriana var. granulata]
MVFNIQKTMDLGAVDGVTKWQTLAPALPDELTIQVVLQNRQALFQSLYLGSYDQLLPVMSSRFPELGMTGADCREMTWLQSMVYINGGTSSTPVEVLLNRTTSLSAFTKNKSDYVKQQAISKRPRGRRSSRGSTAPAAGLIILEPHGGRVGSIADGDTPYPHRAGVLDNIQYVAFWPTTATVAVPDWIKNVYSGRLRDELRERHVWGEKYFGDANFRRLALTKGKVDAGDYFRNEQSVPPLVTTKK